MPATGQVLKVIKLCILIQSGTPAVVLLLQCPFHAQGSPVRWKARFLRLALLRLAQSACAPVPFMDPGARKTHQVPKEAGAGVVP